jgi:hypothetical protein
MSSGKFLAGFATIEQERRGILMRGLFSRILSLTVLLALPLSSALAASAYVHELTGTMTGQYGNAASRALKIGDTIDSGVTLSTGAISAAAV